MNLCCVCGKDANIIKGNDGKWYCSTSCMNRHWNWRDEFEEKTDRGATVLVVVKDGVRHIGLAKDNDGCVYSVQASLIPKPKPKPKQYRPWTRDEVPVGSIVKHKAKGTKWVILGANDDAIWMLDVRYQPNDLLRDYTLLDGSPCGVEERS